MPDPATFSDHLAKNPVAPGWDSVKDSGKRQEFNTGSRRDTREGKGRFDLLPPYALFRMARHYENGGIKYGPFNWALGQPTSRYLDSAMRHLWHIAMGDDDEDHASAAAWNCWSIIETRYLISRGELPAELDDIPNWGKEGVVSRLRALQESNSPCQPSAKPSTPSLSLPDAPPAESPNLPVPPKPVP